MLIRAERNWVTPADANGVAAQLALAFNFTPAMGRALVARGLTDPAEIERFLQPRLEDLTDPFELPGWSSDELHRATHDPSGVLGIEHLTIDGADDELQHWLNIGRSTTRELEICALETFDSPHHPYGASICHGLNRLSSVWYFLQLAWKRGGVL